MKIRTDFVTNSSSSSFVCYVVGSEPFVDFLVNKAMPKPKLTSKDFIRLESSGLSHMDSIAQVFCKTYLERALKNSDDPSEMEDVIYDLDCSYGTDVSYKEYEFTNAYDGTPESAARVLQELFTKTNFLKCIDVYYDYSEVGGGEINEPKKSVYCNGICFSHTTYQYGRGYTFDESEGIIEDYHIKTAVSGLYNNEINRVKMMGAEIVELTSDADLLIINSRADSKDLELAKSLGIPTFDYKNIDRAYYQKNADSFLPDDTNEIYDRITELNLTGVKYLRSGAFKGFSNIKKVTLYPGIDSISKNAFAKCSSLIEINIPDGVKRIGKNAFERCTSLKSITLPESLTTIDSEAFLGCSALEEIIVKGKLMGIGKDAFKLCANLKEIPCLDPSAEIVEYSDELLGRTFVITGTLPSMQREEAIELIERHGGKVLSSVSSKTSYLIAGHEAGSKLQKAKNLNIPVITEEQFLEMLNPAVLNGQGSQADNEPEYKFKDVQKDLGKLLEFEPLLYNALLKTKTQEEMKRILLDLCSIPNLCDISNRMNVAVLLLDGYTSNKVTFHTGASSSTIAKINKILKQTGTNGFAYAYVQLSKNNNKSGSSEEIPDTKQSSLLHYPQMPWLQLLVDTFMSIKSAEAMKYLLYDLCVDSELKSMIQRIKAAEMLMKGLSPSEISKQTGISSSIVKKVDYAMHYMGTGGFQIVLEHLK